FGLPDEVLAAAKADFEPHLTHVSGKKRARVGKGRGAGQDGKAWQQLAPESGLARAQRPPAPAPKAAHIVRARRHGSAHRSAREAHWVSAPGRTSGQRRLDLGTKIDFFPGEPALIVGLPAEVPVGGRAGVNRLVEVEVPADAARG